MSKGTRLRFSPEYKDQLVARLSEPGATYSGVAAEFGIIQTQPKTWRLEQEAAGSATATARHLLARNFDVAMSDTVWLADISHIPTDEG